MSDDWVDPAAESRQRKLSAVALVGIAVLAGLVVYLGITFIKPTKDTGHPNAGPHPLDSYTNQIAKRHPTNSPTPRQGSGSTSTTSATSTTSVSPSPSISTGHKHPVASCPTSDPCTLPTDGGDLIGALNAYRARNGVSSVTGEVTKPAQRCAIGNGDSSACPSTYYWEPVPHWNGHQVLKKIEGNGGSNYLLDPSAKSFAVGWAYDPGTGEYLCAVVAHY